MFKRMKAFCAVAVIGLIQSGTAFAARAAEPVSGSSARTRLTVTSLGDLWAQAQQWVIEQEQLSLRTVKVNPIGAWAIAADIHGTVDLSLEVKPTSDYARQATLSVQTDSTDAHASGRKGLMRIAIRDTEPVWVATIPLRHGSPVDCDSLRREMREVSTQRKAWRGDCAADASARIVRELDKDATVLAADVSSRPPIEQNSEADVAVEVGAIRVAIRGQALADGWIGQDIPVRLPGHPSVVRATVVAPGQLAITRTTP